MGGRPGGGWPLTSLALSVTFAIHDNHISRTKHTRSKATTRREQGLQEMPRWHPNGRRGHAGIPAQWRDEAPRRALLTFWMIWTMSMPFQGISPFKSSHMTMAKLLKEAGPTSAASETVKHGIDVATATGNSGRMKTRAVKQKARDIFNGGDDGRVIAAPIAEYNGRRPAPVHIHPHPLRLALNHLPNTHSTSKRVCLGHTAAPATVPPPN
jgi:hypothetical protein